MKKSPREKRLEADYLGVAELAKASSVFSFEAPGKLPQRYCLKFQGIGVARSLVGKVELVHRHEVIVNLGAAYPRMIPQLVWQTPIFHPNISNNGVVCLGGYDAHWVPSLTLSKLIEMLWDMVRYANFDVNSPYNRAAAMWAREQAEFVLPLDDRTIGDQNAGIEATKCVKPPQVKKEQDVVFLGECVGQSAIEFI